MREREKAQKTRGAANLLVAPSRLGRDGRCGPAHSLLGSARGPSAARTAQGGGVLGAPVVVSAELSAQIWGDCHSTAERGMVWGGDLRGYGSASHHRPFPGLS